MKKERLQELAGVQLNETRDTFKAKGNDILDAAREQVVQIIEDAKFLLRNKS